MADIINLNKEKKARAKAAKTKAAAHNRVAFGRTGSEKLSLRERLEKARREIDQLRRDPPKT